MLIPAAYFVPVAVAIAFAIFILVFLGLRKRMEQTKATLAGIMAALLFYTLVPEQFERLFIINPDLTVNEYRTIGTFRKTLENGHRVSQSVSYNKVGIINNTQKKLVIEEVIYGSPGRAESITGDYLLPAHLYTEVFLPGKQIDQFFGFAPPSSKRVSMIKGSASVYWLHETDEEK